MPLSVTAAATARLVGHEDALTALVDRLDRAVGAAGFELARASLTAAICHESPSEDVVLELAVSGLQGEGACIDLWGKLSDLLAEDAWNPGNSWITERLALVVSAT